MPKAIFLVPFSSDSGLDFNGYELPYETGEVVTVNRENEAGEIVPTEVPLIKGGFSILDQVGAGLVSEMVQVEVEASQEVIEQLKNDENYEFVRDVE